MKFGYRNKMFSTMVDSIDHLNSEDEHNLIMESQTFQCWDDFLKWKKMEEQMKKSWLVKTRPDRKTRRQMVS